MRIQIFLSNAARCDLIRVYDQGKALPRIHIRGCDSPLNGAASGQMSTVFRVRLRFRHDVLHALWHRLRCTLQAL